MILRYGYDPDGLFDIDPAEESHAAALRDQDVLDAIAAREEREMVRLVSENTHMANTLAQLREMAEDADGVHIHPADILAVLDGFDE